MGILDYLPGFGQDSATGAETSAQPGVVDRFLSRLPGAQYMTPEERQGAIGLALLRAGSAGLQASQGRPGQPAPTLGQSIGALAGGLGEGVHGMSDQALKGAAIQAQMMGRQKSILEAQQLAQRNAAISAFAQGDRSPQVLALINPDKAVEQGYKAEEHLAGKGMRFNPQSGRVEYLPGYTQALTQEAEAKAAGTWQPITAGGALVKPPAGGAAPAAQQRPTPQTILQSNPHAIAATRAAEQAGVDPGLYLALVDAESGWNPAAKSPKGAQGLAQLMPDTAKQLGVDPADPVQNVRGGAVYLRSMLDKYQGDTTKALMAYNWGPKNVDAWAQSGADPANVPPETHAYVRRITGAGIGQQSQQADQQNYIRDAAGNVVGIRSPDSASENTFDKVTGEALGKLFVSTQEAAAANRQSAAKMEAIAKALDGIETGKGSEALLEGKRALKALKVDLNAIGLTDNVGAQDAARALANELALELRNPAGGAGMPGALSEQDRGFLQSMSGGLSMTTQGRKLLLEARKRLADRSAQEARLVREYARKNGGRLDVGVYDALSELAARPLFDERFAQQAQALNGAGTSATGQPAQNRVMRWNPRTGRVE